MIQKLRTLTVTVVGICFAIAAVAADKKLSKADLPAPVQRVAEEQSKGATVLGYSSDREEGKLEYEVKLSVDGHSKDITIAPDGQVLEVEEQVSIDKLSAPVKAGLLAKAGKGTIRKIESLTKHGAIVAYEAQVYTAGKHSEVQVGPDGKPLNHEE